MKLISNGPILVVAAHADDEILGCGGAMAKFSDAGHEVHTLLMTDGVSARADANDGSDRRQAACEAAKIVGSNEPIFNDFPDNAMDSIPLLEVARVVESAIDRISPEIVLTHHHGDLNVDHQVVHRAVITACRPQPEHVVKTILSFPVRSSSEWCVSDRGNYFHPNLFIDIESTLPRKMKALEAYAMEMREPPHTRSLQAVESEARLVGNTVGVQAAEGFEIIRGVC
ncbi:MAG: GlcNAc-PI de-N-acetylase [Phycisphaerae bacterium]|nr:GlcNAc-PI de-N-acetylase [Phycisphaerae bacterium]